MPDTFLRVDVGAQAIASQLVADAANDAAHFDTAWMITQADGDLREIATPEVISVLLQRAQFYTDLGDLFAAAAARLQRASCAS